MGRRRRPRLRARRPVEQRAGSSAGSRRPPPTSSIVPTSTRTMLRMKASASISKRERSRPPSLPPAGIEHVALEAHVRGLGRRERREVVGARRASRRTRRAPPRSSGCGQCRARPRSNGLGGAAELDPVAVAARAGVAAGVEAVGASATAGTATSGPGERVERPARTTPAAAGRSSKRGDLRRGRGRRRRCGPATVSGAGSPRTRASASSSSPWTVRIPGWTAQPLEAGEPS